MTPGWWTRVDWFAVLVFAATAVLLVAGIVQVLR